MFVRGRSRVRNRSRAFRPRAPAPLHAADRNGRTRVDAGGEAGGGEPTLYLPLRASNYLFPTQARVAFGQPLSKNASVLQTLGKMRVRLDGAKLATLDAARLLDAEGNKSAKGAIAACKGEFILIIVRAIGLTSFFVSSRGSGCRHRGDRRGDSDPRCVGRVRRYPAGEDVRGCADAAVGGRAGRGSPGDHSQVGSAAVSAVGLI